jgi:hypothetical protein
VLLHLAQQASETAARIPIVLYKQDARDWRFSSDKEKYFPCSGLIFQNVLVDAPVTKELFQIASLHQDFSNLRPDIVVRDLRTKTFTFIEVKTLEKLDRDKIDLYDRVRQDIEKVGWTGDMLALVSVGNIDSAAQYLSDKERRLLLWEDVLRIKDGIEPLRSLFSGIELKRFYDDRPDGRTLLAGTSST